MTETQVQQEEAAEAESVEEAVTQEEAGRQRRKVRTGIVVSNKADKTVTVQVERRFAHPLYGKGVSRTKRYHAHDENNEARGGDSVEICEIRPLSKLKRWRLVQVVETPSLPEGTTHIDTTDMQEEAKEVEQ